MCLINEQNENNNWGWCFRCKKILSEDEFNCNCFCYNQEPESVKKHWCNYCWKELQGWIEKKRKQEALDEILEKQRVKEQRKKELGLFKNEIPKEQRKLIIFI